MSGQPAYHGPTHRRKKFGGTDPIPGESFRNLKLFADTNACDGNLPVGVRVVSAGDGKFIFQIDEDEDGFLLHYVRAYVSVVSSSGAITVQVRNITQAHDMLSTACTIDAGDFSSLDAGTAAVVNTANASVADGDLIAIDVDGAGTDAEGLGVNVGFRQP